MRRKRFCYRVKSKTYDVVMNFDQPIHITETKSSSSNFTIDLVTVEKGKHYTLKITPKSTDTPGIGVIQVFTDSPIEIQNSEQVFAMVQRPES